MLSYWAYILIGNNNTGKTTFQKRLVSLLCDREYKRLPRNRRREIKHGRMPRGIATLSTMSRSYQEYSETYGDIENFFQEFFAEADICILASHAHGTGIDHVKEMIRQLRLRNYNVAGVFFSNGYNDDARQISLLDWDERLYLHNPHADSSEVIEKQIARLAQEFTNMLIGRAALQ